MRSFNTCGASDTNKSGGIHGMSRWQSAEILRYCILFSPLQVDEGRCLSTVPPRPAGFLAKRVPRPGFFADATCMRCNPVVGIVGSRLRSHAKHATNV